MELNPKVEAAGSSSTNASPAHLSWTGSTMGVPRGVSAPSGSAIEIRLDASGKAIVRMPSAGFVASDYGFLQLRVSDFRKLKGAALIWQTATPKSPLFREGKQPRSPLRQASLPLDSWADVTLNLGAFAAWRDTVTLLGLALQGAPNQRVVIEELRLMPATPAVAAQSLLARWGERTPWTQSSINAYPGRLPGALLAFRVPVVVLFLAMALGCYLLIWSVLRHRIQFDWRVAGGIFLLGWVALDAPWQWSLWRQLAETRADFAGQSNHQKSLNAPDGPVYRLIDRIRPQIGDPPARVFVATSSEYLGLRAAYHLYPHNPYWARSRKEMPAADAVRAGDFVLLLQSQQVRFDATAGELLWGRRQRVEAKPVHIDALGQLYQVL
ncbi:hypothetical protein F2Q65_06965 [Thiohalocapsa marina]|uniref:Uncharacterized protein n=1 Tax=Thiohalocapsa marina TaxID=424902 RepID=A0A5M8FME4_9GAMM|nr:hypothetical protein [Thiohalocapsa marina]KAA6186093.1 hypothetical protein F2Q65_06965 [Thiohalocapsa marina]